MILGTDGEKMSKSRGNVINPDDVVNEYGAVSFFVLFALFLAGVIEMIWVGIIFIFHAACCFTIRHPLDTILITLMIAFTYRLFSILLRLIIIVFNSSVYMLII